MTLQSVTRTAVAIASAIAPQATGRAAFWLCCRTSRPPSGENAQVKRAEKRLSGAVRTRIEFGSGSVETYTFPPSPNAVRRRGTIALVHGWTGSAAFMAAFAAPLIAEGFEVVAVDLPGHGASPGRYLHVPLAVEALHAVHEKTGPWHGIAAHSFGGLAALALVSGTVAHIPPVPIERLALIGSPHDASFIFSYLGRTLGLGPKAQAAMNDMVLEVAGRPIEDFDGVAMMRSSGVRALILHAPDDREVPYACAEELAKAEGLATLTPVPGAGHRRILYAPAAIELVGAFMSAPGRAEVRIAC